MSTAASARDGSSAVHLGTSVNPRQGVTLIQKWNAEIADFYLRRLQQCAVLPFELAQCQAADEFVQVQKSFYGRLIDDCAMEAERLTDILVEQATDTAAALGATAEPEAASVATETPGAGPVGKGSSSKAARSA